jgi:hypothetical protein
MISNFDSTSSLEQAVTTIGVIDAMERRLKELKSEWKEKLIDYIDRNGDIEIGEIRLYVGIEKDVTPKNDAELYAALLAHEGGDEAAVREKYFSSNWCKQGQIKKDLGDARHAELFETVEKKDLKTGKPKRGVKAVDPKFIR